MKKHKLEPHTAKALVAPPGARKIVLGLLVDQAQPRLTKEFRQRLTQHIWAIEKFGFVVHARHRKFKSLWGFYRHIEGLIAYAKMVEPRFSEEIELQFHQVMSNDSWGEQFITLNKY